MTYQPVNGLHILAVELTLLGAFWGLALLIKPGLLPTLGYAPSRWLGWLLIRNRRSVLLVILAALIGRALLLPIVGIPEPRINDEYSYLLMADTFAHGRLTNTTPLAWQHFETFHVNLRPTYHSKYPVAQGLVLTFGQLVFHQPWIGVYLSTALLCGAICWTLQAFVAPGWALLGGLLAVVRIALFSYWMNSYWGGSVAALGGVLALGAVVRIFDPGYRRRSRVLLVCSFAAGLLILATSRPYEGLAFSIPLFGYFVHRLIEGRPGTHFVGDSLPALALIGTIGIFAMGYYNHATTGNAFLMPYVLNQRTYWSLPLFVGQKENAQVPATDPAIAKFFQLAEKDIGYVKTKSLSGLLGVESRRFWEDWFFYVGPALTLPVLIGLLSCMMQPRLRIVVLVALSTAIALMLSLSSAPHYAAAATIAIFVFIMEGLRYLWATRQRGERAFVIAVVITVVAVSVSRQAGMTGIYAIYQSQNERQLIAEQLESKPGQHLVLVSYDLERHYPGNELVHNGAEFGTEKILWARSKGLENDVDLCRTYPDRDFWSVTTDDMNYSLSALDFCK